MSEKEYQRPPDIVTFGDWVKAHRLGQHMTQREVARLAGCDRALISFFESDRVHHVTGKKIKPRPETAMAIALAVQGDVDWALYLCGYDNIRYGGFFLDNRQKIRVSLFNADHLTAEDLTQLRQELINAYEKVVFTDDPVGSVSTSDQVGREAASCDKL